MDLIMQKKKLFRIILSLNKSNFYSKFPTSEINLNSNDQVKKLGNILECYPNNFFFE